MKQNDSLLDIVALLFRWRKWLIVVPFVAAILAAAISLTLPNYYKASTLYYPASPDLAAPAPLGEQATKKYIYGSAHDLDRLITISKSKEVRNYLSKTFNLYEHYEIDPQGEKARHKLYLKLNKLFRIEKTKYDAVSLSVEDKDPTFAAKMANVARDHIDELSQNVIKSTQEKQVITYRTNIDQKQIFYDQLMDSLNRSRKKYNIFNTASQGEAFGSSIVELEGKYQNVSAQIDYLKNSAAPQDSILILKGKKRGLEMQLEKLNSGIKSYNQGYEIIVSLERQLMDFGQQLNIDKQRLAQIESAFNGTVSSLLVFEQAEEPEMKSRPKRSILVIGIAFLTFILMALWLLIKDQWDKNNWKEKISNA